MSGTTDQIAALGRAAREMLRRAWAEPAPNKITVVSGLIAVTKTFTSDVNASTSLIRQAIDPAHLAAHGHAELPWIARNIRPIWEGNAELAVDIFQAAYGYAENSDTKTSINNSALLSLTSNQRQDYQGAWYALSESLPSFFDKDIENAVQALARSLDGYVEREKGGLTSQTTAVPFSLGNETAKYKGDGSHAWYRGGYQSDQDAPVLLKKFDGYLHAFAQSDSADEKISRVVASLAKESGLACIWGSLLVAGANNPSIFSPHLAPLACATPVMMGVDTRYQVGKFITAAYSHFHEHERNAVETAILALTGTGAERAKLILAGCIPKGLAITPEMRDFMDKAERSGASQPNEPVYQITSSFGAFDTDAYLASEGVSLSDAESATLRDRIREVEAISVPQGQDLTSAEVRRQLKLLEALRKALEDVSAEVSETLTDHGAGILADAAGRLARAELPALSPKPVRRDLKRILLFCAQSKNPRFSQAHEESFNDHIGWGGPSARTAAAQGLLNFIRVENPPDPEIIASIRTLARDPVACVRFQVIANLAMLWNLDLAWVWSEIEFTLAKEKTRGVINGALQSLGKLAGLDLGRAIRLAKAVLRRYRRGNAPGMGECRTNATILIFDIYILETNAEAERFASELMTDAIGNAEMIKHLIARYSDRLLIGLTDDPQAQTHSQRQKALEFYNFVTEKAFSEIEARSRKFDIQRFASWPETDQQVVQSMLSIIDEVSIRIYFTTGGNSLGPPSEPPTAEQARLFSEARPLLGRLSNAIAAPVAHHLIQTLEAFIPLDPAGAFGMIAQAVRSSEQGGYSLESMAADVVVRIVERYLADYRAVFSNPERLKDLMDCLDIFVRAGWPSAQALTFKLGDIWR